MLMKNTNSAVIGASSVAQSIIEEIQNKAFDEKTISKPILDDANLTDLPYLGPDTGEMANTQFDDIDDYNGYQKHVDLPSAEGYDVSCKVNYVDSDGNDLGIQSFYKKVTITVTSKYMRDSFYMSFIFSLHSKN